MADDLFIAFDNFNNFFPTSERKLLPVANTFENHDKMRWMSLTVKDHTIKVSSIRH